MIKRERVGVVGAGVAGLTAAYLLQRDYDVVLFEAQPRLGGHAHTHDVPAARGGTVSVDTGFLVYNERTYPQLMRLFRELGVISNDSDMSMSVRCLGCGLEYAGGKGARGLLPSPRILRNGRYWSMLTEVRRFHVHATELLSGGDDGRTLGEFLTEGGYSRYLAEHLILPLVSAVWSAGEWTSLRYPARYLFQFLHNHGMLAVGGSPRWRTVAGGSREYVQRAAKNLAAVHVDTPVRALTRHFDGVELHDDGGQRHALDRVVVATHADEALGLLADPTTRERETLGAFQYSRNKTWLHTDTSVLPRTRAARASWNYLKAGCAGDTGQVAVSYHLNRLMRLDDTAPYLVTLNDTERVEQAKVVETMTYEHPIYTGASVAAQDRLPELNTRRTAFAGAYHGWGFHEDGCAAGVRAAAHFGVAW